MPKHEPHEISMRVGTRLGRYLLTDVLGHGAMAGVFRARDSSLGRTVAIKVMNLVTATRSDAAERFRREAKAAAALKHPAIVEIYDFVTATDGEPSYIVVELIEGPTLRELLERSRGRLLPEVAAIICAQIADALAVAHDRGVIHRDVKPDNVMLEKTGNTSRVVITDFGVAHITGLETMTATGALVGSPAYMSPEQARGGDVGAASDLWAVGILLYQMATGALPFQGKDPIAVISQIAKGTFRRPSQVVGIVGPAFERAVMSCLKTAAPDRYTNARVLAQDLRAILREAGITDELATLREFLDDAETFEAKLRPAIADRALDSARRHARRGELGRALAELGRASSYVPNHPGVEKLLRSITARRRWVKILGVSGMVAALVAGAVFVAPRFEAWRARQVAMPVGERPIATPAPKPTPAPAAVPTPPTVVVPTSSGFDTVSAPGKRMDPRRRAKITTRVVAHRAPEAPAKAPPTATIVTGTAEPEKPVQVKLRAFQAFCYPSIDDETPLSFTPTYLVKPGPHTIFCAPDKTSPKIKVGVIEVKPSTPIDKLIKKGPGNDPTRPTL